MNKVLCFGELLLRLSPSADAEWLQANELPAFVGGAEANVATALALWGMPAGYCTALPDNFLSKQLVPNPAPAHRRIPPGSGPPFAAPATPH